MPERDIDILGVTHPVVDLLMPVDDELFDAMPVRKGGWMHCSPSAMDGILRTIGEPTPAPGGSAANAVTGAAHLGCRALLVGRLGDDAYGRALIRFFDYARPNPPGELRPLFEVSPSPAPTGRVLCLVSPDGERTFVASLSAALELEADDVEPSLLSRARVCHQTAYLSQKRNLLRRLLRREKEAGCIVSFDLGNPLIVEGARRTFRKLVRSYVDLLFANAEEARALTGKPPPEAVRALAGTVGTAVVKLGAEGSMVAEGERVEYIPSEPVAAVDSTGAGDAYAAGFLFGLVRGKDVVECARFGTTAAAELVKVAGARLGRGTWMRIRRELER